MDISVPKPFPLLRYFILTSLLIIFVTAILVQFTYRRAVVNTVVTLGESTNVILAQTAMSSVRPLLLEFMERMENATREEAQKQSLSPDLDQAIQRMIHEKAIARVKVYNRHGVVIYSSSADQIGQLQLDNLGLQSALNGRILSKLIYSDSFNPYDKEANETNLIQSYLPAQHENSDVILGAFEIYTDVNFLVKETERSQLQMLSILIGVFLLMFIMLVATVWRAAAVMTGQEHIIRERTRMLEFLTAQMLTDQDSEKKNIAHGLHESVAQTLSGVKMQLEGMAHNLDKASPMFDSFTSLNGYLQDAISETRSIASHLHPFSIDEFGLRDTLKWFIDDLQKSHPQVSIELEINAEDEDISRALKIIIFRIVQDTLNNLVTQSEADRVRLVLRCESNLIKLEIEENSKPYTVEPLSNGKRLYREILPMRERTLLSGGVFLTSEGRIKRTHRSTWEL